MKNLILIIKGFIIGVANIIPGVSGGTLMMSLNIFEDIISSVSHFFSNIKKNFWFLFYIAFGVLIALIVMSRVVTYSLAHFNVQTILFFIGLIVGGVPMLLKNVKNKKIDYKLLLSFIVPFVLVLFMTFYDGSVGVIDFTNLMIFDYIKLFLVGVIAAGAMVIPGLSGSFLLILFGYYEPIMNTIKMFTSFNDIFSNGIILFTFGVGVLLGLFIIIKLVEYLLNRFRVQTYYAILGFVLSSIVSILYINFYPSIDINLSVVISSTILFSLGVFTSIKLGD